MRPYFIYLVKMYFNTNENYLIFNATKGKKKFWNDESIKKLLSDTSCSWRAGLIVESVPRLRLVLNFTVH